MVVLGIWLHVHQDAFIYRHLLRENPTNQLLVFDQIPFLLIGVGFFLAAMSFLGCCGACADSVCFLSFVRLLLLLIWTNSSALYVFFFLFGLVSQLCKTRI